MKILASDLDGTIYRHKNVSAEDLCALENFTKKNLLIIATGRNKTTFGNFQNRFNLNYHSIILNNGALILDANQKIISAHPFQNMDDLTELFKIINHYDKTNLSLSISLIDHQIYMPDYHPDLQQQLTEQMQNSVLGICIEIKNQSLPLTEEIYTEIKEHTSFNIEHNKHYIDILPDGVSKKNALLELMALYQFNQDDMYFIGDAYNDISMFEINHHSFLIDQGNTDLNRYASHIVQSISQCIEMIEKEA